MSTFDIKKILLRLIFLFSLFSIFTQCTFLNSSRRSGRRVSSNRLSKKKVEKKNFSKYIKIDIDNNGLVDSIIYGSSPLVIALNYGDSKYKKLKFITRSYYNKPVLDTVIKIGSENVLILKTKIAKHKNQKHQNLSKKNLDTFSNNHKIKAYNSIKKGKEYIIDSLTVKFGEIVSYNSNKLNKDWEIKEINFSFIENRRGFLNFKIKIKSDRTLKYSNNSETKDLIIQKKFYEKLVGLIQYADVLKLKDNYAIYTSCGCDEAKLSILFTNGNYKEITDDLINGTINLKAIYRKMDEINSFFRN